MKPHIGVKVDTAGFQKEFRARVLRSKKTLAEVTNEVTLQILLRWQRLIPKADRAQIEAFGVTYRTMNKKGTRMLKKRRGIYNPNTAFKLIALKEMWKKGPKPRTLASRDDLNTFIAKKLARRVSSVGFIASGPVPAIRAIIRKIMGGMSLKGASARTWKGTKGSAKPAVESFSPFAEFTNATGFNIPGQKERSQNRVYNLLNDTLAVATNETTAEMRDYAAKRLEDTLHDRR